LFTPVSFPASNATPAITAVTYLSALNVTETMKKLFLPSHGLMISMLPFRSNSPFRAKPNTKSRTGFCHF
jgi:hypothetical protein